ncbi:MAG: hypothetical protein ACJ75B_06650, partial [Flavisolibacter sp.]
MDRIRILDVSRLAQDLAGGCYSYSAALTVISDERIESLIPPILPGQNVPIGIIGHHQFDFLFYIKEARKNPFIKDQMEKVWASGAILTLGDTLAQNHYFDRGPVLELIRHLRNGVAHGNKFNIKNPEILNEFPARLRDPITENQLTFDITPDLKGKSVFFEFIDFGQLITV